jgi:hypothetical protein
MPGWQRADFVRFKALLSDARRPPMATLRLQAEPQKILGGMFCAPVHEATDRCVLYLGEPLKQRASRTSSP